MSPTELVIHTTNEFLEKMGFSAQVSWVQNSGLNVPMVVIVTNTDSGMLIGRQGETLDCIERLVRLAVLKDLKEEVNLPRFVVDINGYRRTQSQQLLRGARDVARKVASNKRVESLGPMTSYERRLVHADLASLKDVETQSVGVEPQRRIIIKPASSLGSF